MHVACPGIVCTTRTEPTSHPRVDWHLCCTPKEYATFRQEVLFIFIVCIFGKSLVLPVYPLWMLHLLPLRSRSILRVGYVAGGCNQSWGYPLRPGVGSERGYVQPGDRSSDKLWNSSLWVLSCGSIDPFLPMTWGITFHDDPNRSYQPSSMWHSAGCSIPVNCICLKKQWLEEEMS